MGYLIGQFGGLGKVSYLGFWVLGANKSRKQELNSMHAQQL